MADFNKALDDIDTLRLIVAKGLSNRGQGSHGGVTGTQAPTTSLSPTSAPTTSAHDTAVTHGAIDPGSGFLEIKSTQQIASMSADEAVLAMKGVYANLRDSTSHNPMVVSLIATLDSSVQSLKNGGATDKIRSLLIQVRNELQASKIEMTTDENEAISAWRIEKIRLRDQINDQKINWQNTYKEKAQLWRSYGDHFRSEGAAMKAKAEAKAKEDLNQINKDFEAVVCKSQDDDFKRNSAKRHGQLVQIAKALKLIAAFKLQGKYGKMVEESLNDVDRNMCRAFDELSKYVRLSKTDTTLENRKAGYVIEQKNKAWKIYSKNSTNETRICISKIAYSVTCTEKCSVRSSPDEIALDWNDAAVAPYGSEHKFEKELDHPRWWRGSESMAVWGSSKKNVVVRNGVEAFVVPDCNCKSDTSAVDFKLDPTAMDAARQKIDARGL